MKATVILLFLLITCNTLYAESSTDYIFKSLNKAIQEKKLYAERKQDRIAALKRIVFSERAPLKVYAANQNLYEEYEILKIDSAISFAGRRLKIAQLLGNRELEEIAQIQLANLYSSTGQYKESEIILGYISKAALPKKKLSIYYNAYIQFFEHYATNSHSEAYGKQAEIYRDSLLGVLIPTSVEYKIHVPQKNIYYGRLPRTQKDPLSLLGRLDAVEIFYSLDDKTYIMTRNALLEDNAPVMLGLIAACHDVDGFDAKFENFSVKHLPDQHRLEWLKAH